jgi:hypothetical protein
MTLSEKIRTLYPELANQPLILNGVLLQNDSDGKSDYIAEWNHPTLAKPTEAQLAAVN